MKLHLPVRLFRAVISLMLTSSPALYATYEVPIEIEIPMGYNETQADEISDISSYGNSPVDVAFRLVNDINVQGLTTLLMTSNADSWLFVSDSVDNLVSLTFKSSNNKLFSVNSSNELAFKYNKGIGFYQNIYTVKSTGSLRGIIDVQKSLLFECNEKVEFLSNGVKSNPSSSKATSVFGGVIYAPDANYINNGEVVFSGNLNNITSKNGSSYGVDIKAHGGAVYVERLSFSGNNSVVFENNSAQAYGFYSYSPTASSGYFTYVYPEAKGGAVYVATRGCLNMTAGGDISFKGNSAACYRATYNQNSGVTSSYAWYNEDAAGGAVYLDSNSSLLVADNTGLIHFDNNISLEGGAIYGNTGSSVIFENNHNILFENNHSRNSNSNYTGGALHALGLIKIIDNQNVAFVGNYAELSSGYAGAIFSKNSIIIENNEWVLFAKNYNVTSSVSSLNAIYAVYDEESNSTCSFSAPVDGIIEFHDGIHITGSYAPDLQLNQQFIDAKGLKYAQIGDILFSGKYVENYLYELNGNTEGSMTAITQSKISTIASQVYLYDGRLRIEDGAVFNSSGITVCSSVSGLSATSLVLNDASVQSGSYDIVLQSGTNLVLYGNNVMTCGSLVIGDGASISLNVTDVNNEFDVLRLSGTLSLSNSISLNISMNDSTAGAGMYKLMSVSSVSSAGLWTEENIKVTGLNGYVVSFDDLKWVGNTLYLNYSGIPGTGESGGNNGGNGSISELFVATWTNEAGDSLWNGESKNWSQNDVDYSYQDGVQVVFGDVGAGTVTLVGDIEPASVLVDSTVDYTWNSDFTEGGKLTGSMELTKKGRGTLTINTANDYTGGTAILGGTVVAGTATALGSGEVRISDSSLIIKAEGFSNTLSTAGNSCIEVQENGSLILTESILNTGNLTISGSINASALQLIGTDDTYIDVRGHEGSSGFIKAAAFRVQVVSGGTVSGHADVTHGTQSLTLGSDGYATSGGGISYGTYYLNGSDSVKVSDALLASSNALTSVTMTGGTLYADASTKVTTTGGNIQLSAGTLSGTIKDTAVNATAGTLSAMLSGTSTLMATGTMTISGSNTHTGGTMFNGGTFTLTHANALGNGTVMTSGTNTLQGNANQSLKSTILNSGALTLSGSWNLSALDLSSQAATHVDINGHTGESGFFKSTLYEVRMVQGGTTTATDLSLTHDKLADGLQLVLGSNGTATAGGVVNYNTYYLAGRDSVSVSEAESASGGLLDNIVMSGGELTVDASTHLTATGGNITVTDDATLSGTITDTAMTFAPGNYSADITADIKGSSSLTINGGEVTLSGNNSYSGGTIINGGSLTADNADALGAGTVTVNGGTLDLNNQLVDNDISLNNGTLVGNDNYNGNLSIGGDNVAVEGGYTLSAGKVLEIAAGGTEFGSDLTLSGGTLLFKGAPLTVEGEVNFAAGTTTLVDLRSWEGQLTDGLTLAVLGSDVTAWTDGCLELIGMGDMSLAFDDSTGSLTLQIAGTGPVVETITWLGAKKTVWQTGRAGWMNATTGYDAVFESGSDVIFTQPGTVTIAGAVEPGSMIVAGDKAITFKADKKNPGRIVGDASLTKRGNGKLTLNDGNTYSGGTFIEAGTITAGGANSFGRGDITISGGTLDLKSKAVINDITLSEAATIKGGKKYLGTYTQSGGELMKGSVLNVAESATISGGVVNGTLSGVGTVTVNGEVELGTSGKITTGKLLVNGSLSASTKGLVMNSKTSAIDINGGTLTSKGKVSAASLNLNGGSLNLSGALSVKELTLGSGTLTLNGAKLATVKVGNSLTLEGGTTLNLGFNVKAKDEGKSFKIFTFKTISPSITDITDAVLNELLGLGTDAATLALDTKRKAITLTVTDAEAWNEYAESVRNGTWVATTSEDDELVESAGVAATSFMLARPAAAVDPMLGKVADTLVQSTWGTAGASRAFGDTIAARSTHATALADGKAAAWISTMGGSSRISSDGGHAGADSTLTGAAFGMEARLSEKTTVGMAIGNSWGKVSTSSAFPVDQDSTHQGIYGKHLLGSSTTLSWMAAHTRTESDANLAGMACDWTQDALQLDARVDKLFAISDRTTVSAFAGMQYLATDKGECNGLSTGSLQNLRGEIGVSAAHQATDKAYIYGELSFIGDMVRNNPTATVGDYRSHGANPGRAGLNLSVGASYQLNDSWSLNGSYSLELMQNQTSHSANVGATYSF